MVTKHPPHTHWFWYLPSLLLLIVAGNQVRLVSPAVLSPWWGGGFGLFATTDAWATRHLHIFAIRSGVRRELVIPLSLRKKVERVLTLPSDAQLQALVHQLAEGPTPDEGPLEAIELQVWATQFDPVTLAPSSAPIRFRTVRPNAPC